MGQCDLPDHSNLSREAQTLLRRDLEPNRLDPNSTAPAIDPITISELSHSPTDYLSQFRRLITLLLPIRYPDAFFDDILSSPTLTALSRVAVYTPARRQTPISGNKLNSTACHGDTSVQARANAPKSSSGAAPSYRPILPRPPSPEESVLGGIRCRLEVIPGPAPTQQLYIQAIAVLSAHRGKGVAAGMLDAVLRSAVAIDEHGPIVSVYAHVWEANDEGLAWYVKRGFAIEGDIIQGYYRRLKPGGARIVRKEI